ncbi:hypothetical protein VNO77_42299 [Canavalia gladiata]|uniref:Uncharacterized protein n=1 Tax=Canavalia gladiata TaxID=3824 RepID=A0AAN9K3T9_CANGL
MKMMKVSFPKPDAPQDEYEKRFAPFFFRATSRLLPSFSELVAHSQRCDPLARRHRHSRTGDQPLQSPPQTTNHRNIQSLSHAFSPLTTAEIQPPSSLTHNHHSPTAMQFPV